MSTPVNGPASAQVNTAVQNQNLLAEIFGSSTTSSTAGATPQPPRATVDDILGLFGTSTSTGPTLLSSHAPPASAPAGSAFSLPSTQSQMLVTPTPAPAPPSATSAAPRLTSYTAYERHELKVTLTPQTSPTRPGVVMILARFQVTGSVPATNLNFQAAVPKVSSEIGLLCIEIET